MPQRLFRNSLWEFLDGHIWALQLTQFPISVFLTPFTSIPSYYPYISTGLRLWWWAICMSLQLLEFWIISRFHISSSSSLFLYSSSLSLLPTFPLPFSCNLVPFLCFHGWISSSLTGHPSFVSPHGAGEAVWRHIIHQEKIPVWWSGTRMWTKCQPGSWVQATEECWVGCVLDCLHVWLSFCIGSEEVKSAYFSLLKVISFMTGQTSSPRWVLSPQARKKSLQYMPMLLTMVRLCPK